MAYRTDLTVQLQRLADAEGDRAPSAAIEATVVLSDPKSLPSGQRLAPGQMLGHYRIEAHIGHGGTGTVYRAHDGALERTVAIKRIHQQLCSEDWDHLKREATALMRLQHPNIATFFDLEEQDDMAWLAMEFVEGVPLSEHLRRHGTLPDSEILALADGLLCALGHAHAAGVVHADIKPENIMLGEAGQVKVLDFGIARLVHDIDLPDDEQYTRSDTISGSPGFMPPEQLRASGMDARSDLFAVAAVLFQAATGEPAFGGDTAADRIRMVLNHNPGDIARRLPGPLGELLDQTLHPDPRKRPASAAEMLHALRQVVAGNTEPEPPRALLLLPPEASPEATDLAWLGRALNNALRPMLEQAGRFDLVPDARAAEMRNAEDGPIEMAQKLAARWVVHGRLDRRNDAIELSIGISDVPTARTIAQRQVTTPLEQLFSLQLELATWVAEQLAIDALPAQQAPNWDATELCARAESAFARGGKDGLGEAGEYYARALAGQPHSTAALAGLSGVHAMRYTFTSDPADIARARELAEQALAIDPDTYAARQWLVYVLMRQHQPDEAMRETDIIMQRASDPHMACYFAACCLAAEARYEDALRYYQTSLRINPSRSWSWFGAGNCHARLGRLENARWCLQRAIEAESSGSHFTTAGCGAFLAELLRSEGEYEKAWEIAKQALQTVEASDFIYRDSFRALALISLGRIALDRRQARTAETAFHQAELGIRGRPRTLGAGHLLIQAMAGKAAARQDPELLQQAEAILGDQGSWNFDWLWGCHEQDTQQALSHARQALTSG